MASRTLPDRMRKQYAQAVDCLGRGDLPTAKRLLLQLSRKIPDSPEVWYSLGICLLKTGDHAKAIAAFRRVLAIVPDEIETWVNLGITLDETGQENKAEEAARRALEIRPDHARALNLAGSILARRKEVESARECFNKALETDPSDATVKLNLANLELECDNLDIAETLIGEFASQDSRSALPIQALEARLHIARKAYGEASAIVGSLLEAWPDEEDVLRLGVEFREAAKDLFGVIELGERLLGAYPRDAGLWKSVAQAHYHLGNVGKARDCLSRALKSDPDNPEFHDLAGLIHSALGDRDNAERHYRKSLEINPGHATTCQHLAMMKKFATPDDPDARMIRDAWERDGLDDQSRIYLGFALGKIHDELKDHDRAFEYYDAVNRLKFAESGIDLDAYFGHMERIVRVFDSPPFKTASVEGDVRPIFILGMPRSGTTLVEQILARHGDVHGCGELPCIEKAVGRLERGSESPRVYPDDFWGISREELEREAAQYFTWVGRLHDTRRPCITDKMPFNFVHVWLIRALFPDAPIIHCRRHPLDVIVSNYFQLYESDISMVYDLEVLAGFYVRYHRIMKHWGEIFPDLFHIGYEDLVANFQSGAHKLVSAAGLEWQDSCLDPGSSNTSVRTASVWQARQEIYTGSKERWRNYERHLSRVIEILSEAGIVDSTGNPVEG
ncbi:MAG: tetratricopeptide repeat protein [Gammaproteobacteria bacterium]|nr:tetratricopeptide repeat protein [Gammaproteobacteria bacterium]MYJ52495.1 tetratricopeptide repeat protein [Gammaproteobacteria bacterium]